MDLGIKGKWALVCGASKGLGLGCAQALAAEGVNLLIVARGAEALEQSAMNLRAAHAANTGAEVLFCAQDITTVAGREAVPRLLDIAEHGTTEWRVEALRALEGSLRSHGLDPCKPSRTGFGHGTRGRHRNVASIMTRLGTL